MSGGGPRRSVLVSLGSNIEPERNLLEAVELLARRVRVVACSRVFVSRAVAPDSREPMPDFFNAAVEVESTATAGELKYGVLRDIEARLGRRRSADRNAPRTIDLDVALFAAVEIESEPLGLTVPDPEILTRPHVAVPLADLAPDRRHPRTGEPLARIARRLESDAAKELPRLAKDPDLLRRRFA